MKVEQIDHIHIAVKDLDKAVSFFEKLFGIKFYDEILVPEWSMKSRIAALGPVGIELIQPTSPDSVFAKFIERKGEGVQAISFKVPDLEEAKSEMKSQGIRLVSTVNLGRMKEAQFHPKDAHGVLIELCEYQPVHGAYMACFEEEA